MGLFLKLARKILATEPADGELSASGHFVPRKLEKGEKKSKLDLVDDSYRVGMRKRRSMKAEKNEKE